MRWVYCTQPLLWAPFVRCRATTHRETLRNSRITLKVTEVVNCLIPSTLLCAFLLPFLLSLFRVLRFFRVQRIEQCAAVASCWRVPSSWAATDTFNWILGIRICGKEWLNFMLKPFKYCFFHYRAEPPVIELPFFPLLKKVKAALRRNDNSVCAAWMQSSITGQFGDVIESAFKRCAGVKDSSTLFGPHGGMLDRVSFCVFLLKLQMTRVL